MRLRQLAVLLNLLTVALCVSSLARTQGAAAQRSATRYSETLPSRFLSQTEAKQAGCAFGHVEGPTVNACVLTGFTQNQMDVVIYERSEGSSYTAGHHFVIPSWSWGAKLSFLDAHGTDWLVVDTEGMRGTGISQRILLVIAWDGRSFRTVAAESLGYGCYRPSAQADYKLEVQHAFGSTNGAPSIRLDYELLKDNQRVGSWSDSLDWNTARFSFEPVSTAAVLSGPTVAMIRQKMTGVRDYFLSHRLAPPRHSPTAATDELTE
jgi:hypothetical protein